MVRRQITSTHGRAIARYGSQKAPTLWLSIRQHKSPKPPTLMAKAELDTLLNKLQGRITGDSDFYATHRNGKTIISNYPKRRDPKKISATQHANSSAFGLAVKQCKTEMNDPERLAYWQQQYDLYVRLADKSLAQANNHFFGIDPNTISSRQKYYSTLRGFIIAQLYNNR